MKEPAYREEAMKTAIALWGEDAERARLHIETTADAVEHVSKTQLTTRDEPATRLRHGDQP